MLAEPLALSNSSLPSPFTSPVWMVTGPGRPAVEMENGA